MSSFWVVKNGVACENIGKPLSFGNTSFATGCSDAEYLAAGLYLDKQWEGMYDPRLHWLSIPSFIVNEGTKEVQTQYTRTNKTSSEIAAYDQAILDAEANRLLATQNANRALAEALTPYLPIGGAHTHIESDVINLVSDLQTRITAAVVPNSSYRDILSVSGSHVAARVAGKYAFGNGNPLAISGTGTLYPIGLFYLAATDYPTINQVLTTKLRIRATLTVNAVAPTGNYTISLYPVTDGAGAAGLKIYTLGTAVAGSSIPVITAPAAGAMINTIGLDFAFPYDGVYCLGVVTTAVVAASSLVHLFAKLQMRNT